MKLQELIDWKEVGVPKKMEPGRERRSCLIFRKNRRQIYNSFLKALGIVDTKNSEQEQKASEWRTKLRERLERIENVWRHRLSL